MTQDQARLPETFNEATAASLLGFGADWLARKARQGLVPHYRVGSKRRYTEVHLKAYLESCEVIAVDPWARTSHSSQRRRRT